MIKVNDLVYWNDNEAEIINIDNNIAEIVLEDANGFDKIIRVPIKDINPSCKSCKGKLILIKAVEPYFEDHYQCDICDSTFNMDS